MAQDFAKQRTPTGTRRKPIRAATKAVPAGPTTHWRWYISGLLSGVVLAIAGYLGVLNLQNNTNEMVQSAQSADGEANPPRPDFSFYKNLAAAEVAVDVTPVPLKNEAAAKAVKAEDPVNFLLQAGSFQDRQDAENRRAKIILLNMTASIAPGLVSGRTWYRVQVGPFEGRRSAEDGRNILSENNIDSIPMVMR